jgi:hypothetical protein
MTRKPIKSTCPDCKTASSLKKGFIKLFPAHIHITKVKISADIPTKWNLPKDEKGTK